jgi:DNA invertase Pin-like site-specific DNA recombinase
MDPGGVGDSERGRGDRADVHVLLPPHGKAAGMSTTPTRIPAIAYGAKSTEDKHGSIPTQIEDVRKMAVREGWTIEAEYTDEAFSGYSSSRGPGLLRAREHAAELAKEHGRCVLAAQHSDRFARGDGLQAMHLAELWFAVRRQGVEMRSVQDDSTFTNPLLTMALGERNAEDSRRKALSVKDGMRRRAERGKLSGGPRPYGYRWVSELADDGRKVSHLEVVPAEAEIVRRMFTSIVNGVSQRELARQLNKEKIPTSTGKAWVQGTLSVLLTNPLYKGEIRHDGEVYPGKHDPIVSEALWGKSAEIRLSAVRRHAGRHPKGSHLMTKGLLRCSCGEAMLARTNAKYDRQSYECSGRITFGLDYCDQVPVERSAIDGPMLGDLLKHYIDLAGTRRLMEGKTASDLSIARDSLAQAEAEALRAQANHERIRGHYHAGRITPEMWAEERDDLAGAMTAAEDAVQQGRKRVEELEASGPLADSEEALLRRLAGLRATVSDGVKSAPDLNAMRMILRQMFETVRLLPADHPWLAQVTAMCESGAEVQGGAYYLIPFLRDGAVVSRDASTDRATIRRAVLPVPPVSPVSTRKTMDNQGFAR